MKVYLFHVESGLFLGEDFLPSEEIDESEGITALAPPAAHPGSVPVFDRPTGSWKLLPVSAYKPRKADDD